MFDCGRIALLAYLLGAVMAVAVTTDERLARGEVVVTRLPPGRPGGVAGESKGVISAPVARVWAVLGRSNEFSEYMPNYLASWLVDYAARGAVAGRGDWRRGELEALIEEYRLADWNSDTALFYNVVDLPFPFPDRWSLLKMWRDTAAMAIYWNEVAGNLRANDGEWRLEPWGTASTLVTYRTLSVPGLHVPEFLLAVGLNQTLPAVIKNLRKRVLQ
jgi:hypothetical protein